MIVGWIANTGSFYHSEVGAAFIGAIIPGFMVGYLARWVKTWKVPKPVKAIMPIIVIPIVTTTVIGLAFVFLVHDVGDGPPQSGGTSPSPDDAVSCA